MKPLTPDPLGPEAAAGEPGCRRLLLPF